MYYVTEQMVQDFVNPDHMLDAIEGMFSSISSGEARNFDVTRDPLGGGVFFGTKSGFNLETGDLGVKIGGLWPRNVSVGIPNHQSTVLLIEPQNGLPLALVRASYLTALRTAAASAISIKYLARRDAAILGIVGAGGQAFTQIQAALRVRSFSSVLVADQSEERARDLVALISATGVRAEVVPEPNQLAARSDVIITVTPSFSPFLDAEFVRGGTHLACMGADTKGKHEIQESLLASASVFADDVDQAIHIGECQHGFQAGLIDRARIATIGDVITGRAPGRPDDGQITIFDGTGIGLQDIVAARLALDLARSQGKAIHLA